MPNAPPAWTTGLAAVFRSPGVLRGMSRAERQWWGVVDLGAWSEQQEARVLASSSVECLVARDYAGQRIGVTLRWPARDLEEALRRIHDVVGLDPTAFTSGYPLPL
jgi:hypothetical protein